MIEAVDVSKWFGDLVAVSEVSFTVGPGVTALLGPNGAGKSTVLRMVCGLTAPARGQVRVLGRDPRTDLAIRRRISLVPQQETMFEALTPFEFVRLAGVLHGVPDPDRAARAVAAHRRARSGRPAQDRHLLEGHAPAGQGGAGPRQRSRRRRARRATHRPRPPPATAPHRPVPATRRAGPVRAGVEPRARRGRAVRLPCPRDRPGAAGRDRRLPGDPRADGRPPAPGPDPHRPGPPPRRGPPRAGRRARGPPRRGHPRPRPTATPTRSWSTPSTSPRCAERSPWSPATSTPGCSR